MTGALRVEDTVGRLGGDEFAVILENIKSIRDAEDLAYKLAGTLSGRFRICSHNVTISCSIGIAIYPQHALNSQAQLRKADTAIYCAKNEGRNNFQLKMRYPEADANRRQELLAIRKRLMQEVPCKN